MAYHDGVGEVGDQVETPLRVAFRRLLATTPSHEGTTRDRHIRRDGAREKELGGARTRATSKTADECYFSTSS